MARVLMKHPETLAVLEVDSEALDTHYRQAGWGLVEDVDAHLAAKAAQDAARAEADAAAAAKAAKGKTGTEEK